MASMDGASTFAKGLRVIECFESGRADLTMADIARMTGFDRATARRLCLTLEGAGYLVKSDRVFRLSPKIVAIAGGYLSSYGIGKAVQPVLNQFAEQLQGEIALAVLDGQRAIYIARSAVSSARLSLGLSVGSTLPLLPTAVGRMLLAMCPQDRQSAILTRSQWRKYTDATDIDPASLGKQIEQAKVNGFAYTVGEFEPGAAGLAVPLQAIGGREAVLATTASINQFQREGAFERALDALRNAAISLRP